jgi:DNA-binding transcriptional LysR family regulator
MHYHSLAYYALSFVAVVRERSFTEAAKKIGISKAQLSRHISTLESMLNVQLMHRTTRTIALTDEGKRFFTSCEHIEQSCADAMSHLKQDNISMQGTLRITAPIDFGIQFISPIIPKYSQLFPNMNITLSLSNVYENVMEENYDIAIRVANQLPDSSLRMRTLMKFKRLFCAAPSYFSQTKKPKTPAELKHYQCITSVNRNSNILYPQWVFQENKKRVSYRLERFIEIDSLIAQRDLVLSGVGIGRLPDYFIRNELKTKKLIELFPHIEKPDYYAYLLYPNTLELPKKTRAFIELLQEQKTLDIKNTSRLL